jgi:hypothetical protein
LYINHESYSVSVAITEYLNLGILQMIEVCFDQFYHLEGYKVGEHDGSICWDFGEVLLLQLIEEEGSAMVCV